MSSGVEHYGRPPGGFDFPGGDVPKWCCFEREHPHERRESGWWCTRCDCATFAPYDPRASIEELLKGDMFAPPCTTISHAGARRQERETMKLTCPVVVVPPEPATGLGAGAVRAAVRCGQPAVIVILTETDEGACCCGDHFEHETHAYPVCADHAPEEVHEARSSMDASEFLVLDLPTNDAQEN